MNLKQAYIVYGKELKDILRDRRTLISMIVIPILIFPLLSGGIGSLIGSQMKKIEEKTVPVAVIGSEGAPGLVQFIRGTEKFLLLTSVADTNEARKLLEDEAVQTVLVIPEDFEGKAREFFSAETAPPALKLIYNRSRVESEIAFNKLQNAVMEYQQKMVSKELERLKLRGDLTQPFTIHAVNSASEREMGGAMAGMILPYLVIVLTLLGAMYPAIDLTAGEKERGTMETLLVSPVGRMEIVLGKFLCVLTASIATAALSMMSLIFTMSSGFFMASANPEFRISLDFVSLLWVIPMLLPLAGLFSALLLTIALFARSYREAQSYLSPLMIVAILPAMVSMVPGVEPSLKLALVPVINVALMLKEVIIGSCDPLIMTITLISTLIYAGLGIWVAFRQFQRESVLFRV